jgi:hypothetical protein
MPNFVGGRSTRVAAAASHQKIDQAVPSADRPPAWWAIASECAERAQTTPP